MKLEFSRQTLEKYSTVKSRENPSTCSKQTDGQTERDMTKLLVGFRSFANAAKNETALLQLIFGPVSFLITGKFDTVQSYNFWIVTQRRFPLVLTNASEPYIRTVFGVQSGPRRWYAG